MKEGKVGELTDVDLAYDPPTEAESDAVSQYLQSLYQSPLGGQKPLVLIPGQWRERLGFQVGVLERSMNGFIFSGHSWSRKRDGELEDLNWVKNCRDGNVWSKHFYGDDAASNKSKQM